MLKELAGVSGGELASLAVPDWPLWLVYIYMEQNEISNIPARCSASRLLPHRHRSVCRH